MHVIWFLSVSRAESLFSSLSLALSRLLLTSFSFSLSLNACCDIIIISPKQTRAEQMNQEMSGGELGLGELEDIMDMADGGSPIPGFVKDMDIPELTKAFEILGSTETSLGEALFVEKYGETLFRQSGWTPTAELINGRCANWLRVGAVEHFQRGRVDGHLHAPDLGGVDGCRHCRCLHRAGRRTARVLPVRVEGRRHGRVQGGQVGREVHANCRNG